jgi:hypothetical protein
MWALGKMTLDGTGRPVIFRYRRFTATTGLGQNRSLLSNGDYTSL